MKFCSSRLSRRREPATPQVCGFRRGRALRLAAARGPLWGRGGVRAPCLLLRNRCVGDTPSGPQRCARAADPDGQSPPALPRTGEARPALSPSGTQELPGLRAAGRACGPPVANGDVSDRSGGRQPRLFSTGDGPSASRCAELRGMHVWQFDPRGGIVYCGERRPSACKQGGQWFDVAVRTRMTIGPEHSLPFGCYEPTTLQSYLIAIGRRLPRNWAGRRIASLIRSFLKRYSGRPIDVIRLGSRMRLYPRSNSSEKRLMATPQFFDAVEMALLKKELTAEFVFLDVGANAGAYTLFVANRVGRNGRIIAVEPHPTALARLQCN